MDCADGGQQQLRERDGRGRRHAGADQRRGRADRPDGGELHRQRRAGGAQLRRIRRPHLRQHAPDGQRHRSVHRHRHGATRRHHTLANTGGFTVDGGSTLLLTGTQGGTVTTGATGTFQIGNGGTTGIFTGNLVDNGTLVCNHSDAYTFGGALTGAGMIVKQGAAQLMFGSGYAFTGVTAIQGGSVKLTTPVAASTEFDVEGSGQLDLSGSAQKVAELAGASSAASVNIGGGSLTTTQATDTSFAGALVGNGSFTKAAAAS